MKELTLAFLLLLTKKAEYPASIQEISGINPWVNAPVITYMVEGKHKENRFWGAKVKLETGKGCTFLYVNLLKLDAAVFFI